MTVKVGYLGPRGTFGEEAARRLLAEYDVEFVPYDTHTDLLLAVRTQTLERAVIAIENSLEGSVPETTNWIVHHDGITICAETVLPVRHHLLVNSGAGLSDITDVMSHAHAVAQCRVYLRDHLPRARVGYADSTADAARLVSQKADNRLAAIGTSYAAEVYGLTVCASDIQDEKENFTRFFLVGSSLSGSSPALVQLEDRYDQRKTSLLVTLAANHPGALFHVLSAFAQESIDLTRIESRPTRQRLGNYFFFIDCVADAREERMQRALAAIHREGSAVRVLGSYPLVSIIPEPTVDTRAKG